MGLFNSIKESNIVRNVWTQMAQITILCGLIAAIGTSMEFKTADHCGGYAFMSFAAIVVTGVVFVAWLLWSVYVLVSKTRLIPMAPKGYRILDAIDFALFAYWIIFSFFPAAVGGWIVPLMSVVWIVSLLVAIKYKADSVTGS